MAAVDGVLAPSKQRRHDDEPETAKLGRSADSLFRNPRGHGRQRQGVPEVVEPSQEFWEKQEPASIADYLKKTASDFFDILDDYREEANKAADKYWKRFEITRALACINYRGDRCPGGDQWRRGTDSALGRHNSFHIDLCLGCALRRSPRGCCQHRKLPQQRQQATNFRESRELLLSRHREYYLKWLYYIEAYGESPMACVNAGRLYCGLVNSDQELRQTLKELAKVRHANDGKGDRLPCLACKKDMNRSGLFP